MYLVGVYWLATCTQQKSVSLIGVVGDCWSVRCAQQESICRLLRCTRQEFFHLLVGHTKIDLSDLCLWVRHTWLAMDGQKNLDMETKERGGGRTNLWCKRSWRCNKDRERIEEDKEKEKRNASGKRESCREREHVSLQEWRRLIQAEVVNSNNADNGIKLQMRQIPCKRSEQTKTKKRDYLWTAIIKKIKIKRILTFGINSEPCCCRAYKIVATLGDKDKKQST